MRFLFFKFRFDPWTKTPQHTLPSPAVESRIELAPNGEKKSLLWKQAEGRRAALAMGVWDSPGSLPVLFPAAFPGCWSGGEAAETSEEATSRGKVLQHTMLT